MPRRQFFAPRAVGCHPVSALMTPGMPACIAVILLLGLCLPLTRAADSFPAEKAHLPRIRVASDNRSFETENGGPYVPMGVTYYQPGTGWAPQIWRKWDLKTARQDFAQMKSLGVNCVRVFLTYGSFYSQPGVLNPEGLEKFDQFLNLAEESGIYVHPTGPDHWEGVPAFARPDRYADEALLESQADFWKLFAARYRGRSVIFAYDLLNEPQIGWDTKALRARWNQWTHQHYSSVEKAAAAWGLKVETINWDQVPVPDPKDSTAPTMLLDYQHFRESVADEWTRRQVKAIKAVDPAALVTIGYIQWSVPALLPGINHYAAFRPERQTSLLDFLEIHFYPLEHGFYEYATRDDEQRNLAYLESVVREVARNHKPVVVAEFGWYGGGKLTIDNGRHPAAAETNQARWCANVVETTAGLATGWLNWGLHDHPEARDVSQLTGLLTVDGNVKEWGREFQKLAQRYQGTKIKSRSLGPRPVLDWDRCLINSEPEKEFRARYIEAYRKDFP